MLLALSALEMRYLPSSVCSEGTLVYLEMQHVVFFCLHWTCGFLRSLSAMKMRCSVWCISSGVTNFVFFVHEMRRVLEVIQALGAALEVQQAPRAACKTAVITDFPVVVSRNVPHPRDS